MKTCRTHIPERPIIIKYEDIPRPSYKTTDFVTGSSYDGEWLHGYGMQGHGVYTFPNGVVYEGKFEDGTMHGNGELRYQTAAGKIIIQGEWKNDVLVKRKLIFEGSMEYDEDDWKYCKMPDRRYSVEYAEGLQPSGNSFLTTHKPPIKIPPGCYDVGDGVYDPAKRIIFKYDMSKSIRRPSDAEQKWIIANCRVGKPKPLGPRPDLYETLIEPTTQPAPGPEPVVKPSSKGPREYIG